MGKQLCHYIFVSLFYETQLLKQSKLKHIFAFNPTALRMAKTPLSFGCSECNRIKKNLDFGRAVLSNESNRKSKLCSALIH